MNAPTIRVKPVASSVISRGAPAGAYEALQGKELVLVIGSGGKASTPEVAAVGAALQGLLTNSGSSGDFVHAVAKTGEDAARRLLASGKTSTVVLLVAGIAGEDLEGLLEAAQRAQHQVVMVYCSDAGVVFEGRDLKGVTEEEVQGAKTPFQQSLQPIAQAERAVLASNSDKVKTCAVRPAGLYGPTPAATVGDTAANGNGKGQQGMLYSWVRAGAQGTVRRVGGGANVADFTFAGNAAHAMLLAAARLSEGGHGGGGDGSGRGGDGTGGRAFFVSDGEPTPFWDKVGQVLMGVGYFPGGVGTTTTTATATATSLPSLPVWLALLLSFLLRLLSALCPPLFRPPSVFLNAEGVTLSTAYRYFSIARATGVLGYTPLWTGAEGLDITLQTMTKRNGEEGEGQQWRNPKAVVEYVGPFSREEVSKHTTEDDVWIIVNNRVFDVTPFVEMHPGGEAILRYAGGDSTKAMDGPQHPAQAREILESHFIGELAD